MNKLYYIIIGSINWKDLVNDHQTTNWISKRQRTVSGEYSKKEIANLTKKEIHLWFQLIKAKN